MEQEYEGQVAAVTGAASGIGLAVVKMFTEAGARVAALDINLERVTALANELCEQGYDVTPFEIDISGEQSVVNCFRRIREHFGRLDVMVNSAGIITFVKLDGLTSEMWDKVVNVNMRGTFLCSREAAIIMKEQRSGAIVNISAGAAKNGGINPSASYIASKGGIHSLTFHFARQLYSYSIRVNCICPGPVDTPMLELQAHLPGAVGDGKATSIASVPLGVGYPEDIAYGVLFLASPIKARYITGEILDINGGLIMD